MELLLWARMGRHTRVVDLLLERGAGNDVPLSVSRPAGVAGLQLERHRLHAARQRRPSLHRVAGRRRIESVLSSWLQTIRARSWCASRDVIAMPTSCRGNGEEMQPQQLVGPPRLEQRAACVLGGFDHVLQAEIETLAEAARMGFVDLVTWLLDRGVDIESKGRVRRKAWTARA